MPTYQTHHGACHCGRVTFALQAKLAYATYCNCSICRCIGALWHGASDEQLKINTGESELNVYQFGTHTAQHYFCPHCGVHPFSRPRVNPAIWVVNVRCIASVDLEALPLRQFDGQNWEAATAALHAS